MFANCPAYHSAILRVVRGIADQFSDDEMNKIKHYGQMFGGGVTAFDEAVEEALNKRDAAEEASAKKMHAAQTGGGDIGLGSSDMDQDQIKQRGAMQQQAATAAAQSAAQAQGAQQPVNVPPAPAGPQGTNVPFSIQKDAVGGPGNATPPPGCASDTAISWR